MKSKDKRSQDAADSAAGSVQAGQDDLRQHAEALARKDPVQSGAEGAKDLAALSPEQVRQALHELRVYQIELEMQNEELRAAQAALEASRERYFDLYDMAPVGYCTLSEQGLILEANLTAATLLGVTRSALIQQPISRFIHQEDQDIYYMHRKKLLEAHSASSGQAHSADSTSSPQASSAGEPQACELRLVKPDGATFWAHLVATVAQAPSTSSGQAPSTSSGQAPSTSSPRLWTAGPRSGQAGQAPWPRYDRCHRRPARRYSPRLRRAGIVRPAASHPPSPRAPYG